jgi:hypothetical protein
MLTMETSPFGAQSLPPTLFIIGRMERWRWQEDGIKKALRSEWIRFVPDGWSSMDFGAWFEAYLPEF